MARVLLADDEDALRFLMGRQLRKAGHDVTLAEDGLVAAGYLETEEPFDVVVSDVKMPRLDGMGLLAWAREASIDVEFVILTGHGSMENAVEAFKTGNVFDYLLKPLDDIHELSAVVARAVERHKLRQENSRLVYALEGRIQELEETRKELAELADQDGLTGMLNHRAVHARLQERLSENRYQMLSVVQLDMDGFKQFNDTYGHPFGDQVLRHIAKALRAVFGEDAIIGRCGGDEFMVLLPGRNARQAGERAKELRRHLSIEPFRNPDGTPLPIHLCIGVADTAGAGHSPINLVSSADAALYEGKKCGGDKIILHMVSPDEAMGAERTTFDVLDSLVTAIDNKDRYTKRHSEDVTSYALHLAQLLQLSDETMKAVRVAGLLHDVGKIGVPDSILRKPGKLTNDEYEVMKNHVIISGLIIHGLPRLTDVLDAITNHHERWDGAGYPRGLAGEQIPLLGRVMAIADAFSAMTLDRPYRAGMSVADSLAEIELYAGSQFDPILANLFVAAVRASNISFEQILTRAA